jgi:hypothetical protein
VQKRSKHVEAAKSTENGSERREVEEGTPHSEVAALHREVSELRELVAAQGKLVKDQVHLHQ